MLPIGWLVLAVVVAILLTVWVTFTLTRLDRLHARVDAAQAALDAQLVRRAAALSHVAVAAPPDLAPAERTRVEAVAQLALDRGVADQAGERGPGGEREAAENAVGREVAQLAVDEHALGPAVAAELREAATRVLIARRFYNDAVRDTRALRARRMPRLLHLAGHRALPDFFDIDDTIPPSREQDHA
ncbi:NUDIX hydrolase [Jatrophihabitans endophyticus]|uniref:NUDIX hydrolase n=1 Tax=Jatrophihabitans endophyticus TaxID=1206085 RepID=UPI0019F94B15|nr:NUDIX hydrolase [Jatrophihabitans endophyticus]MBE7190075.1 hypothetical protein [Jatrophihabitans endophyticus]